MEQFKTASLALALMLGASSLAFAQTSATTPKATASPSANAGSGSSTAPKMTEQDVKKKLEGDGYSQVSHVKQDKDGWMATAMKGGKQVSLDIDNDGKIKEAK